jgi:hypothetical protein
MELLVTAGMDRQIRVHDNQVQSVCACVCVHVCVCSSIGIYVHVSIHPLHIHRV